MRAIYSAVKSLLTPITLGVILSLPFALASPLKALLVNVPGWTDVKIPNAPDGKPPLSFFYDVSVQAHNTTATQLTLSLVHFFRWRTDTPVCIIYLSILASADFSIAAVLSSSLALHSLV